MRGSPVVKPGNASEETVHRSPGSRLLHIVEDVSESPISTILAVVLSVVFLGGAAMTRRLDPWLPIFAGVAEAIVLVMVFTLQHTQARQQAAVQRKLDEILQALPGADNRMVHVESASEDELEAADEEQREVREEAVSEKGGRM